MRPVVATVIKSMHWMGSAVWVVFPLLLIALVGVAGCDLFFFKQKTAYEI